MLGIFCKKVELFERGQMYTHYCQSCNQNQASRILQGEHGDGHLYCPQLEYRITYHPKKRREVIPLSAPYIWIPRDLMKR